MIKGQEDLMNQRMRGGYKDRFGIPFLKGLCGFFQ